MDSLPSNTGGVFGTTSIGGLRGTEAPTGTSQIHAETPAVKNADQKRQTELPTTNHANPTGGPMSVRTVDKSKHPSASQATGPSTELAAASPPVAKEASKQIQQQKIQSKIAELKGDLKAKQMEFREMKASGDPRAESKEKEIVNLHKEIATQNRELIKAGGRSAMRFESPADEAPSTTSTAKAPSSAPITAAPKDSSEIMSAKAKVQEARATWVKASAEEGPMSATTKLAARAFADARKELASLEKGPAEASPAAAASGTEQTQAPEAKSASTQTSRPAGTMRRPNARESKFTKMQLNPPKTQEPARETKIRFADSEEVLSAHDEGKAGKAESGGGERVTGRNLVDSDTNTKEAALAKFGGVMAHLEATMDETASGVIIEGDRGEVVVKSTVGDFELKFSVSYDTEKDTFKLTSRDSKRPMEREIPNDKDIQKNIEGFGKSVAAVPQRMNTFESLPKLSDGETSTTLLKHGPGNFLLKQSENGEKLVVVRNTPNGVKTTSYTRLPSGDFKDPAGLEKTMDQIVTQWGGVWKQVETEPEKKTPLPEQAAAQVAAAPTAAPARPAAPTAAPAKPATTATTKPDTDKLAQNYTAKFANVSDRAKNSVGKYQRELGSKLDLESKMSSGVIRGGENEQKSLAVWNQNIPKYKEELRVQCNELKYMQKILNSEVKNGQPEVLAKELEKVNSLLQELSPILESSPEDSVKAAIKFLVPRMKPDQLLQNASGNLQPAFNDYVPFEDKPQIGGIVAILDVLPGIDKGNSDEINKLSNALQSFAETVGKNTGEMQAFIGKNPKGEKTVKEGSNITEAQHSAIGELRDAAIKFRDQLSGLKITANMSDLNDLGRVSFVVQQNLLMRANKVLLQLDTIEGKNKP